MEIHQTSFQPPKIFDGNDTNHHLLELYEAMHYQLPETIPQKFDALSTELRQKIYGLIQQLASEPNTSDYSWAEQHRFENLTLLHEAVLKVIFDLYCQKRLQFKQEEPLARDIQDICSRAIPFTDGMTDELCKAEILYAIRGIPFLEREDICQRALSFTNQGAGEFSKPDIFHAIHGIPLQEREDVCVKVRVFMDTITDSEQKAALLTALGEIPSHERGDVCAKAMLLVKGIANGEQRSFILNAIGDVEVEEREGICSYALPFIENVLDGEQRARIITAIYELNPTERGDICAKALSLAQGASDGFAIVGILCVIRDVPDGEREDVYIRALPLVQGCVGNRDGWKVVSILSIVSDLAFGEREEVCSSVLPIMQGIVNIEERARFLEHIYTIASDELKDLCVRAFPFAQGMSETRRKITIIDILGSIPLQERDEVCPNAFAFAAGELDHGQAIFFLEWFMYRSLKIPRSKRRDFYDGTMRLKEIPVPLRRYYLQAFEYFPPDQLSAVAETMLTMRLDQTLSSLSWEDGKCLLIREILSQRPDLRPLTYSYLTHLLGSDNALEVRDLALTIWNYQYCFWIDGEHQLAQEALHRILLLDNVNDPKNPYVVHNRLKEMAKMPTPHFVVPRTRVASSEVIVNFEALRQGGSQTSIEADLVPKIDKQMFLKLVQKMQEPSDAETQEKREEKAREMTGFSFNELCENFAQDEYLLSLVDTTLDAESISLQAAFFRAIIYYVACQSTERKKRRLFSPQEEALLKMSASIQSCNVGKYEGIVNAYNCLENRYKYQVTASREEIPSVVAAKRFVREVVHNKISNLLSTDNPMMRELTGSDAPISQLSHQSLYVKNLIAFRIGVQHALQFDLHSHCLSNLLLNRTLVEVLTILFRHVTVGSLIAELRSAIERAPNKAELYGDFNDLLEHTAKDRLDQIWNVDECKYTYSLSESGALQILLATNFIRTISVTVSASRHRSAPVLTALLGG